MHSKIVVTAVRFHSASLKDQKQGLAGWAGLTLNGRFRLESIAIRRTLDGRVALSFPARTDRAGQQRFYFRPLDNRTRRAIEEQVFCALGPAILNVR